MGLDFLSKNIRIRDGAKTLPGLNATVTKQEEIIKQQATTIKDDDEQKRILDSLARKDVKTELYNRRFFEEEILRLKQATHVGIQITILDIDRLKKTNDTLGHPAGDTLIREVADIIRATVRVEDIICIIGGDEFAVIELFDPKSSINEYNIYKNTTEDDPLLNLDEFVNKDNNYNNIAYRLQQNINFANQNRDPSLPKISISIRYHISVPGMDNKYPHDLKETIEQADIKLYEMKELHHQAQNSVK